MDKLFGVGRFLFAAGVLGFGVQALVCAAPVPGLEPIAPSAPGGMLLANATGVGLVVLAGGMLLGPRLRGLAALVLAGVLATWLVLLHAPALFARPGDAAAWSHAFMAVAVAGGALALAERGPASGRAGRLALAAALIAFGVIHLIYRAAIAEMIPTWIPGRAWWPWLTGPAQVAAGLTLASGVMARPAAALTGLMFLAWIALLHIPAVASAPGDAGEWNRLLIALALCGGAWIVGGSAGQKPGWRIRSP